jgi:hypothetical protein
MMEHLAERQPRIVLHRVEKIFPALKESLVSVLCINAQEIDLLSCSLYLQSRKVKLSLGFINEAPHHEDVWGSGGTATPFLNFALYGGELSASCLSWSTLGETAPFLVPIV